MFMITGIGVHDPPESVFTIDWNLCSRSNGIRVHNPPESAVSDRSFSSRTSTVRAPASRFHVANFGNLSSHAFCKRTVRACSRSPDTTYFTVNRPERGLSRGKWGPSSELLCRETGNGTSATVSPRAGLAYLSYSRVTGKRAAFASIHLMRASCTRLTWPPAQPSGCLDRNVKFPELPIYSMVKPRGDRPKELLVVYLQLDLVAEGLDARVLERIEHAPTVQT